MVIQESKIGGVVVLNFQGRLDVLTAPAVQDRITALMDRGERALVADLGRLDHIASAGLRVFMTAAKRSKSLGGNLVFASLQPYTEELFNIAGFSALFTVYPDAPSAIAALTAQPDRPQT